MSQMACTSPANREREVRSTSEENSIRVDRRLLVKGDKNYAGSQKFFARELQTQVIEITFKSFQQSASNPSSTFLPLHFSFSVLPQFSCPFSYRLEEGVGGMLKLKSYCMVET